MIIGKSGREAITSPANSPRPAAFTILSFNTFAGVISGSYSLSSSSSTSSSPLFLAFSFFFSSFGFFTSSYSILSNSLFGT